jgi:hypothetical protein
MFHSNTELLIDYWRTRRGERALPPRARIDPADFAALLPQAFIVAREAGDLRFRLAGETINDLHGRFLGSQTLLPLWRADHRGHLTTVLDASLHGASPVVIDAEAETHGGGLSRLEILFAPLAGPDGQADRFLGLYQPATPFGRSSRTALQDLAIRGVNGALSRPAPPKLRLAVVNGRRIA